MAQANNPDSWVEWHDPVQNETTGYWEVHTVGSINDELPKEFRTWQEADTYIRQQRLQQMNSGKRRPRIFNDLNPDTF